MQKLKSASFFRNDDVITSYTLFSLGLSTCKKCTVMICPFFTKETFSTKKIHHVRNLRKKPGHNLNSEDFLLCKDSKLSVSYQYFLFKLVNTTYQKRSNFPRKTFTLLRIKVRLFYRRKPTTI